MKKIIPLKLLTICIFAAQQSYALELIQDKELGSVTGQDGISITHEMSKLTIDQANWYDQNTTVSQPTSNIRSGLGLHNLNITSPTNENIKSTLNIDVGATDQGAGLGISASISPFNATADLYLLKFTCSTNPCSQQTNSIRTAGSQTTQLLGKIGLSTSTPFNVHLQTNAGLFNKDVEGTMVFQLQNATLSHQLGDNKLILNDFNFNFAGTGYLYLDSQEGLVLSSYNAHNDNIIDLNRVIDITDIHASRGEDATNPGVNIDLRYYTPNNERKNIIRMGASGAITKAKIAINADQSKLGVFDRNSYGTVTTRTDTTASGYDIVAGEGGLHLKVGADFLNQETLGAGSAHKPTVLEIGHTGKGSYAVEFSNLRALTKTDLLGNPVNASIDFGDIYINTINAQSLNFLINKNLTETLRIPKTANNYSTFTDSITQNLVGSTSNDYALIAIRSMDFQAIASKAQFISDNSLAKLNDNTGEWGIGIPIYNLNANLAITGATYGNNKQGIAYNLIASTEGYGIDKKTNSPSTTSLLLIDGHTGEYSQEAVNYYAGLRNIDAFVESNGVIGYEDDGIMIRADKLLIAANAEFAVGQLPGSKYNCAEAACDDRVSNDIFGNKSDVITTIAFKLDGKGNFMIIPGIENSSASAENQSLNFLSFTSNFTFADLGSNPDINNWGSYISLSNEDSNGTTSKKSSVMINRMQGEIGLNGQIYMKKDAAVLDTQVKFNNKALTAGGQGMPFKAEIAMAPSGAAIQKVADLAITGGVLRSTLMITPR